MASPPILDFDSLLAPIAGADPAGAPLPFEVRKKLDDLRKEVDPNKFAADDPRRPTQPQHADWPGIEQLARETLTDTSKDLLVAARLLEALVKSHGFAGLRDGLRLLRRLVQQCWDRMHPAIVDGDAEARSGPFTWLDDENRGAVFPFTIRTIALTQPKAKDGDVENANRFGWQHWKDSQDPKSKVTAAMFDQAVAATPREYCQSAVDDIAESIDEVNGLFKELGTRLGEGAPGLSQVRKALLECQDLARQILQRKGPPPVIARPADSGPSEGEATADANGAAHVSNRPLTREDVLTRLAEASAMLLEMEPHSPIAYLVQRAVKLARLPFPDLMKVLVRDTGVLGQLDRDLDLGLEPPDAAKGARSK